MSEPLVVIGNGMAAARLAEELSKRALGRYAVAVIGEEPRLAYNRVLLSSLLADEIGLSDIELKPARWWRDRGVTLRYGVATAIDTAARGRRSPTVSVCRSPLVFATGSQPIKLNPGWTCAACSRFGPRRPRSPARPAAARTVVIGSGLLGLEAAYGSPRPAPASPSSISWTG